jgi:hypothetical protein
MGRVGEPLTLTSIDNVMEKIMNIAKLVVVASFGGSSEKTAYHCSSLY